MKKLFLAALAMLGFVACTENADLQPTVEPTADFAATFAQTRTDLDGNAVVWNENDMLTIFTRTSHNRQYKLKEMAADRRSATFGYVGYTGTDNTKITTNYAIYPYDAAATLSAGVVTTTLAPEQRYNSANGTLSYALMAAASADNNFYFDNATALMRFKVYLEDNLPDTYTLNSIKVASVSNKIAGEVTIDLNAETKVAVVTENGVNEVVLTDINATITTEVQQFYIALPAASFADNDVTVTFFFEEGEKTFELPAFELTQSTIKTVTYAIKAEDFIGYTPGCDGGASGDGDNTVTAPTDYTIWYTATSKIEQWDWCYDTFNANIVSHEWDSTTGVGFISFDAEVTKIGLDAFNNRDALTTITIPDSVTEIGFMAFHFCDNLYKFNGRFASEDGRCLIVDGKLLTLAAAGLTSYEIPSSVTVIEGYAFTGCTKLVNITIPNSVTEILTCAFEGCESLTGITIPNSVTRLGPSLFNYCNSLASFSGKFASEDGKCLIADGVLNSFARAGVTSYTIPSNVTTIGRPSFEDCQELVSVTIPDNVKVIDERAFARCANLTSIYCESIEVPRLGGISAFEDQAPERKIYVPYQSVNAYRTANNWREYAADIVAYDFEKGEVVAPAANEIWYTTTDGQKAELKSHISDLSSYDQSYNEKMGVWVITFEDNVADIYYQEGLFPLSGSNVQTITLPEGIKTIPVYGFARLASLTSIIIPDGVETIERCAFENCTSLTEIVIPDSVTTIGEYAFIGCSSLANVRLGNSVNAIGYRAFNNCANGMNINIPASVEVFDARIPDYTAGICNNMANVRFESSTPSATLTKYTFYNTSNTYYVPEGSRDAYSAVLKIEEEPKIIEY